MADNTFLGLQPYTEDDAYRFKGRTEESQELFRLIMRNDFTVCYAESGEGKTSLLNAGVFPLLRENMFFPIAITFTSDDYKVTPNSFDTIIDRCIKDSIVEYNMKNKGINVEYKLCSTDFQGLDCQTKLQLELSKYSWWKLRNYKPQAMGLTFTPVFVFDQFEEVFNLPGSIVWTKKFFDWLEDVSSDSCPDDIAKKVRAIIGNKAAFPTIKEEKGFKAVFSLRKEFIGELDYWGMQRCFIPSLKDNRYCLKALTYEGAKKVMTQQERFDESKVEQILKHFVSQYSRESESTIAENLPAIPALLLSVVCDSWEKDFDAFAKLGTAEVAQSLSLILEHFYSQAIDSVVLELSRKDTSINTDQCRHDLYTAVFSLIDGNGKRVRTKTTTSMLTQIDFDNKYKQTLCDYRIIKVNKVDGEDYVEIVHDSLCPIIAKRKEERLAEEAKEREERLLREQARKVRKRMTVFGAFAIAAIGLMAIFLWQNRRNLMTQESLNLSEAKNDSLQNLKELVEKQKNDLREDSILLASHLSHILNDSVLLADKNDSLKKQIAINQQQDKIIESLEAFSKPNVSQNVAGELSKHITPDLRKYATSLTVSGQLNGTDIALIREMLIDGNLRHLNLEQTKIIKGGSFYYTADITKGLRESTIKADNELGNFTFSGCTRLLSIVLPTSVTSIEDEVLGDCRSLISITIPNSVTRIGRAAFRDCSSLTSITIPNSVTRIGTSAFWGCRSLTSINIPNKVTSIESFAFDSCSGLTSINIPNSVESIGIFAFSGCSGLTSVNIPRSVTSIGNSAFSGCSGLTSVNIPSSVTSIGNSAFSGCSGLTSVNIPGSVTSIENDVFSSCSSLKTVSIPNSVKSIGSYTFKGCSGLTSVNIPNSVKSIGISAFEGCSGLKSATIPSSVTSIGFSAFKGCSDLTSVNIPDSITSIELFTFHGCSGLKSISIPNSVTSIGGGAFYQCSGLTSVNIPNSVTTIGESAFQGCSGLASISIPNSVTSIGNAALLCGINILRIQIKDIEKVDVGENAFGYRDDIKWIVPAGPKEDKDRYVKKYKAQPWWNEKWQIEHE